MERASNRAGRIGTEWNMDDNEAPSVLTVLHIAPESLVHVLCGFPVPDPAQLCSPFFMHLSRAPSFSPHDSANHCARDWYSSLCLLNSTLQISHEKLNRQIHRERIRLDLSFGVVLTASVGLVEGWIPHAQIQTASTAVG